MTEAWRVCHRRHAERAFTGRGTREAGSRWCSAGVGMTFAAATLSLAMLEILVHLKSTRALAAFVGFRLDVPDELVEELAAADLPTDWRAWPWPGSTRALGDAWIAAGRAAGLWVPSAVVPRERNLLLNVDHAEFTRIGIEGPLALDVDGRLVG